MFHDAAACNFADRFYMDNFPIGGRRKQQAHQMEIRMRPALNGARQMAAVNMFTPYAGNQGGMPHNNKRWIGHHVVVQESWQNSQRKQAIK
jgi:hypothetical protein